MEWGIFLHNSTTRVQRRLLRYAIIVNVDSYWDVTNGFIGQFLRAVLVPNLCVKKKTS